MLKNIKILYVEDEIEVNNLVCNILRPFVKEIRSAYNGKEALELYKTYIPDIIITDIQMPYINGLEMIKKIKESNSEQYVIILSAFSDAKYLQEAIKLKVDSYVLKPVVKDELFDTLHKLSKNIVNKKELLYKDELLLVQSKQVAIGELIEMITHQWKQPLSVLSMIANNEIADIELNQKISNESIVDSAKQILTQVEYLSETIDEFRDFLKPNKETETISASKLISQTYRLVKKVFEKNNINIIDDISNDINIVTYPKELIQVLINILNNSKDAFCENNIINRTIKIRITKDKENILIETKDNAGGIEESIIDKIYQPYFTTKPKNKGTGIGLYMVKNIIQKHLKGTITTYNCQEGICTRIELPTEIKSLYE